MSRTETPPLRCVSPPRSGGGVSLAPPNPLSAWIPVGSGRCSLCYASWGQSPLAPLREGEGVASEKNKLKKKRTKNGRLGAGT